MAALPTGLSPSPPVIIRSKIEINRKEPTYIKTVRGVGYRFEMPLDDD